MIYAEPGPLEGVCAGYFAYAQSKLFKVSVLVLWPMLNLHLLQMCADFSFFCLSSATKLQALLTRQACLTLHQATDFNCKGRCVSLTSEVWLLSHTPSVISLSGSVTATLYDA